MTKEYLQSLDEPSRRVVGEPKGLIEQSYPATYFAVMPGAHDPQGTWLLATVDTDDSDEVTDMTIERELTLQIEESIAVYVIPTRTPGRTAVLPRHTEDHAPTRPPPPSSQMLSDNVILMS